jgi:hypothetical protein
MELKMTTNKLTKLIAMFCGWVYLPAALAHPGHEHNQGIAETLLHTAQTEWLAPVALLVLLGLAGYLSKLLRFSPGSHALRAQKSMFNDK